MSIASKLQEIYGKIKLVSSSSNKCASTTILQRIHKLYAMGRINDVVNCKVFSAGRVIWAELSKHFVLFIYII